MPSRTLKEIARRLGGELEGDPSLRLERVREPQDAGPDDLAVAYGPGAQGTAEESRAGALVVGPEVALPGRHLVRVGDPRSALIAALELLHPRPPKPPGVDPRAAVDPQARIAASAHVAAGAWIGRRARLGEEVEIGPNAVIGDGVEIGDGTLIAPNVTVHDGSRIGRRVRIGAGSVIGSPGFGYLRQADGRQRAIPQVGRVILEDEVEVGANVTIDRATLGATVIGRGTKIDNQVQIGHNSEVGEDCCLVAQVGISGSVRIGRGCVLLGQSGVHDHVTIADGTYVGAQSGVADDLPGGEWLGLPVLPAAQGRRVYALLGRLPEIWERLRRRSRGDG